MVASTLIPITFTALRSWFWSSSENTTIENWFALLFLFASCRGGRIHTKSMWLRLVETMTCRAKTNTLAPCDHIAWMLKAAWCMTQNKKVELMTTGFFTSEFDCPVDALGAVFPARCNNRTSSLRVFLFDRPFLTGVFERMRRISIIDNDEDDSFYDFPNRIPTDFTALERIAKQRNQANSYGCELHAFLWSHRSDDGSRYLALKNRLHDAFGLLRCRVFPPTALREKDPWKKLKVHDMADADTELNIETCEACRYLAVVRVVTFEDVANRPWLAKTAGNVIRSPCANPPSMANILADLPAIEMDSMSCLHMFQMRNRRSAFLRASVEHFTGLDWFQEPPGRANVACTEISEIASCSAGTALVELVHVMQRTPTVFAILATVQDPFHLTAEEREEIDAHVLEAWDYLDLNSSRDMDEWAINVCLKLRLSHSNEHIAWCIHRRTKKSPVSKE